MIYLQNKRISAIWAENLKILVSKSAARSTICWFGMMPVARNPATAYLRSGNCTANLKVSSRFSFQITQSGLGRNSYCCPKYKWCPRLHRFSRWHKWHRLKRLQRFYILQRLHRLYIFYISHRCLQIEQISQMSQGHIFHRFRIFHIFHRYTHCTACTDFTDFTLYWLHLRFSLTHLMSCSQTCLLTGSWLLLETTTWRSTVPGRKLGSGSPRCGAPPPGSQPETPPSSTPWQRCGVTRSTRPSTLFTCRLAWSSS